jgi:hypothetical protein
MYQLPDDEDRDGSRNVGFLQPHEVADAQEDFTEFSRHESYGSYVTIFSQKNSFDVEKVSQLIKPYTK